jgi:hypothetical protein
MRYPKIEVNSGSTLAAAVAYNEKGGRINGHLAVDQEGHVVFVEDEDPSNAGNEGGR